MNDKQPVASVAGEISESELRDRFATRRDTFRAGYAAGSADITLKVIRTLRLITAVLERNLAEDVAFFDGDDSPHVH